MGQCERCGKRGLFVFLNGSGLCKECRSLCRLCGKNTIATYTTVEDIGLCLDCGVTYESGLRRWARIIADCIKRINNSNNKEICLSSCATLLDKANNLLKYEQIGIPTISPPPSTLIPKYTIIREHISKAEVGSTSCIKENIQIEVVRGLPPERKQYRRNNDIIKGYEFFATLKITTPSYVLNHHGEILKSIPNETPQYGTFSEGIWLPKTVSWKSLGLDIEEMPEGESASDVGPINSKEYLPFLKKFREIVESNDTVDFKIKTILTLCNSDKRYKAFCQRLNDHYDEFPESFFYQKLAIIPGIGKKASKHLFYAGYKTIDDLKNCSESELSSVSGIGTITIKNIKEFFKS